MVQVRLSQDCTHPKFDPTKVWTHDLQIMDSTFHVRETAAVTTEAS